MSGRQPGAVPSIRRVTTADGRRVVLQVTAGKRRNASAVYVGRHRATGDRLVIRREPGGWQVLALVRADSPNLKYADRFGRCLLADGLPTLQAAAGYCR